MATCFVRHQGSCTRVAVLRRSALFGRDQLFEADQFLTYVSERQWAVWTRLLLPYITFVGKKHA